MSESLTRLRIVNIWAESVPGVRTSYYQIPRALQDAELPGMVVFPGAATYDKNYLGEQLVLTTRIYEMVLYLCKAAFGTEGQLEIQADPYFDQVESVFLARPGLELTSQGANQSESEYDALILGDNGLQVGSYPLAGQGSPEYVQIRWRLQVKEVSQIIYQD